MERAYDRVREFERFYAENWSTWVGQTTLLLGCHLEAELCVQDVMGRAWRSSYRSGVDHDRVFADLVEHALSPFEHLFRLARLVGRRRRVPVEGSAGDVLVAVADLPRMDRSALVLTQVMGLSLEDAARRLRVPPRVVRARLQSARGSLASSVLTSDVRQTFVRPRQVVPGA